MSGSDNPEKDGKSWGRDLAIFGAGMVTGAVGTVVAGHFFPAVPVPKVAADVLNGPGNDPAAKK
ncbi:hypothetical protein [Myxococcus sp. RHSTA-1-4]|uniref:hypothetical protein n=1 Tax=Myxococcus sp. RHSTA-1-4 TaxID=2874601 RepID=UPI001CC1727C|nr:hypothetical protein [Myxococcus sp. RHSTA-1-4]MBZ4422019.1 hypothetical protein [Myxococcus sp. RHSTA-1-4]